MHQSKTETVVAPTQSEGARPLAIPVVSVSHDANDFANKFCRAVLLHQNDHFHAISLFTEIERMSLPVFNFLFRGGQSVYSFSELVAIGTEISHNNAVTALCREGDNVVASAIIGVSGFTVSVHYWMRDLATYTVDKWESKIWDQEFTLYDTHVGAFDQLSTEATLLSEKGSDFTKVESQAGEKVQKNSSSLIKEKKNKNSKTIEKEETHKNTKTEITHGPKPKTDMTDDKPGSKLFHRTGMPVKSPKAQKEAVKNRQDHIKLKRSAKSAKLDAWSQSGEKVEKQGFFDLFNMNVKLDPETRNIIESMADEMSRVGVTMNNFSPEIQVKHSVSPVLGHLPVVLGLAVLGVQAIRTRESKWIASFLALSTGYVGMAGYIHRKEISELTAKIASKFGGGVESQGLADGLEDVVGLLVGYLSMATAVKVPAGKKLFSLMNSIGSFEKTRSGVMSSIQFVVNMFQKVLNWFRTEVLDLESVNLTLTTLPELKDWSDRVVTMVNRAHTGSLEITMDNSVFLKNLELEGAAFLSKKSMTSSEAVQVRSVTAVYMAMLRELQKPFAGVNISSQGPRTEPICVLFMGKPGVGKTWALFPLIKHVLLRVHDKETRERILKDWKSFVYSRVPEQEYWDGYNNQDAVIIDDFGQSIDVPGSPDNEFMGMIRSANMMPFVLHMADLAKKGITTFTSRFIYCTTNLPFFSPNSIADGEALMRRFDFIIEVVPKLEYCIDKEASISERRFDRNHATAGHFNPDIYEFHRKMMKPQSGGQLLEGSVGIFSFEQLTDMIVDKHHRSVGMSTEYLKYVDDIGRDVEVQSGSPRPHIRLPSESIDDVSLMSLDDILKAPTPGASPFSSFYEELKSSSKMKDFVVHVKETFDSLEPRAAASRMFALNSKACKEALASSAEVWRKFCDAVFSRIGKFESLIDTESYERFHLRTHNFRDRIIDAGARMAAYLSKFSFLTEWKTWVGMLAAALAVSVAVWKRNEIKRAANTVGEKYTDLSKALQKKLFHMFYGENPHMHEWEALKIGDTRTIRFKKMEDGEKLEYSVDAKAAEYLVDTIEILFTFTKDEVVRQRMHDELAKAIARTNLEEFMMLFFTDLTMCDIPVNWEHFAASDHGLKMVIFDWLKDNYDKISPHNLRKAEEFIQFESQSGVPKKKLNSLRLKSARPIVYAEGGLCPNEESMYEKVSSKSHYTIEIDTDSYSQKLGHALFLRGKMAIIPHHFIGMLQGAYHHALDSGEKFTIKMSSRHVEPLIVPLTYFLDFKQTPALKLNDLCIVNLMPFHDHPDITRCFVLAVQLNEREYFQSRLFGPTSIGTESKIITCQRQGNVRVCDLEQEVLKDVVQYIVPSKKGDCGTVLTNLDKSSGPGKIMGMHVAGSPDSGIGYSSIITREMVEEAVQLFSSLPPPEEVNSEPQCMEMPFPGSFVPYFKLDKPVSQPCVTKIARSPFHGKLGEVLTAPAMLRATYVDGVLIDPFHVTLPKYGPVRKPVDDHLFTIARDYYFSLIMKNGNINGDATRRIFSFEEACAGIEGDANIKSLPRSTSAGFPYVLDPLPGHKGKQAFFGKGEHFTFTSPHCVSLKKEVEHIISEAREGRRCFHVYVDTLKDEPRKLDRASSGATRIISAAPLAHTIALRMYVLDFMAFMLKKNIRVGVAVGVNPYSEDWDMLANELNLAGPHVVAGDVSGFDYNQCASIILIALEIINMYYDDGEENKRIRRVLFHDIAHSIHLYKDVIYQWLGGLPSGNLLTALLNSMVMCILVICCWIQHHPQGTAGLIEYESNVKTVTLGDDSISAVSDPGSEIINYPNMFETFKGFGIPFTDENKNTVFVKTKKLSDVNFLKRTFRKDPEMGRYVAPLLISAITDSLAWTQKGSNYRKVIVDKVDTNLLELSLHSEEDFQQWAPLVVEVARSELNHYPTKINRSLLLREACKMEYQY